MVTSMLVNFLLMCITVLTLKKNNFNLYQEISVFKKRIFQLIIGWVGIVFLSGFLLIHTYKDLNKEVEAWYFHSTYIWLLVMFLASIVFLFRWNQLKNSKALNQFKNLPLE
jgi:anaerobic C4-dicarboxylate transporter